MFEASLTGQRKQRGGVNAAQEDLNARALQARILETRLNRTVQKYNSIVTANNAILSELDTLTREKSAFQGVERKYLAESA